MPELLNEKAVQAQNQRIQSYGLPSAPAYSFDVPDMQPQAEESFFHPVKAINDIVNAINNLASEVSLLVKDMKQERTFIDRTVQIGLTVAYAVDYLEHKYVYILANSALTLVPSTGGTIALTANKWQQLSLPRGTLITVQGGSDAAPAVCIVRACDVFFG